MIEWEKLASSQGTVERAKVPGGWLVRSTVVAGNIRGAFTYPLPPGMLGAEQTGHYGGEYGGDNLFMTSSLTFYPDPEHTWTGDSL